MNQRTGWLWAIGILCAIGCGSNTDVPPGGVCTLIGCDSGAIYSGLVSLGGADPTTLEVRTCMNGTCDTQKLRAVPSSSVLFECLGPLTLECQVQLNGTMANFDILTKIPKGSDPLTYLNDGDMYQLTLGAPGQTPIVTRTEVVTYKVFKPNGTGCSPTCKQVILMP